MNKNNWGGIRKGAGRTPLNSNEKKKGVKIYITDEDKYYINKYGNGKNFSQKVVDLIHSQLKNKITNK